MIIDVQNTLNEPKTGSMFHFFPSRSLNFSTFAVVMVVSQCAVGETIFYWRAADGSPTFSDRPPFDTTDVTIIKSSNPTSSPVGSELIEEWLSDKPHPKAPAKGARRDLPFACKPAIPTQP